MIFTKFVMTSVGKMALSEEDGALVLCSLTEKSPSVWLGEMRDTPLLLRAEEQLREYFAMERQTFDLPVRLQGTPFQQAVWQALREIPYGETRTYGDIARRIGHPRASRAVGMANHANRLLIIVPCHRVIGANGQLTGFGAGLPVKEYLLRLEDAAGRIR